MPNKGEKVVEKQLDFGKEGGYLAAHSHTQSVISEEATQVVTDVDGGDRNEKKDQHAYKKSRNNKTQLTTTGKQDWEELSELDNARNQEAAALKLKDKKDLEYERLNSQIQMRQAQISGLQSRINAILTKPREDYETINKIKKIDEKMSQIKGLNWEEDERTKQTL